MATDLTASAQLRHSLIGRVSAAVTGPGGVVNDAAVVTGKAADLGAWSRARGRALMRRTRVAIMLPLLLGLGACARPSAPITIGQALREVQQQLLDAGAVSAVGTDPARFAVAVRQAQCASNQADPEVPLLAHELEITLTGSFTATGGFSVGPSPLLTFVTGSGSRTQGQQIALPLTFVALSEVPAQSAAQRLATIAALPQAEQRLEATIILADRDALQARIAALIGSWTPAACPGTTAPAGPLLPNAKR